MSMDGIKLFSKNEKELLTLIQSVRIYSQNIEMDSGIRKWDMFIMKSGKGQITRNRTTKSRKS